MRFRFAKWADDRLAEDFDDLKILAKTIILSEQGHFDLDGYVNKQNCRIWGTENSHAYIEKPTNPKRVNGDRYRAMSNEFLFRNIDEQDIGNI